MGRRRRVARRDARPAGEGPRDGGPHGDPNLGHPPGRTPPAVRALRDLAVQGPRAFEVAVPEGDRGGPPDRDRGAAHVAVAAPPPPAAPTRGPPGLRPL